MIGQMDLARSFTLRRRREWREPPNQIIRKALPRIPDDLVIITKVRARRGKDGSWIPAFSREELTMAIQTGLVLAYLDRSKRGDRTLKV